jgi:hypothetical protein
LAKQNNGIEFVSKELKRVENILSQETSMRGIDRDNFTIRKNILGRVIILLNESGASNNSGVKEQL